VGGTLMAYGPLLPLAAGIQYTTLDAVKQVLMISDTASDPDLTQAIIAAETAIDQINGRSFPDDSTTEPVHGDEIDGIPDSIKIWALDASIAVFKLRDTTAGFQAGSDDWIGTIDVSEQVRRALRRNPMALGFRITWGLA